MTLSDAGVLRSAWLPIRRRLIPHGSRRDRAYHALRRWLARTGEPSAYLRFQAQFEPHLDDLDAQRAEAAKWRPRSAFCVVTVLRNMPVDGLEATAKSLLRQTYPYWEWRILDFAGDRRVSQAVDRIAAGDPRIHAAHVSGQNEAAAIKEATRTSVGDFVILLGAADELAPWALYRFADVIRDTPDVDCTYGDSDHLDRRGVRHSPRFKPDWSPELLLSANYLLRPVAIRRSLFDQAEACDAMCDEAFEWALYLRLAERSPRCVHVAEVLCHSRGATGQHADIAASGRAREDRRRVVADHLGRLGVRDPHVEIAEADERSPRQRSSTRVEWHVPPDATVSVVIPTLDQAALLASCLDGLLRRTAHAPFEIVIVDTGSREQETFDLYERMSSQAPLSIVRFSEPFNFSKACNFGVRRSRGKFVLLLNNDVEILDDTWLTRMLQWFEIDGVGIVGPKLVYPDGRINHGGVTIGIGGLASQLFAGDAEYVDSVFGPDGWYRNLSAVTGACLLTSRALFDALGGLDERFVLNYSDIDFCVRARAAGWRIVFTPDARLVHHESISHGRRIPRSDFLEASRAFEAVLRSGDPFFNANLSCRDTHPSLRLDPDDNAWNANRRLLARLPDKPLIQLPDDVPQ
jgi:GT2 family glycosyltransferase